MARDYILDYNHRMHSGIGTKPYDRYQATKDRARVPESRDWLDMCFLNRIERKVRKDATVSIDSVSYDVPMEFIGQKVEIRYEPNDMETAFILSDEKRYAIRLTDKVANCHTKRNNFIPLDYTKIGD